MAKHDGGHVVLGAQEARPGKQLDALRFDVRSRAGGNRRLNRLLLSLPFLRLELPRSDQSLGGFQFGSYMSKL